MAISIFITNLPVNAFSINPCVEKCGQALHPVLKNLSTVQHIIPQLLAQLRTKGALAIIDICIDPTLMNFILAGFTPFVQNCNGNAPCCTQASLAAFNIDIPGLLHLDLAPDIRQACHIFGGLNQYSLELITTLNDINCGPSS